MYLLREEVRCVQEQITSDLSTLIVGPLKMQFRFRGINSVHYNRLWWVRCAVFSVWAKASKGIRQIRTVTSGEGLSPQA